MEGETAAQFERRFAGTEREYAFASVVRCSLTGMDRKKGVHTADSPNVLPAFKVGTPGHSYVENCVDEHLVQLPSSTNLVLLLGNTDAYMKGLRQLIGRRRGKIAHINEAAFWCEGVKFIHLAHPSKGNGHFGGYLRGEGKPGEKLEMAREAMECTALG